MPWRESSQQVNFESEVSESRAVPDEYMYTACDRTVKRSGASRELTPISNLPVQSQMLERLVAQQLQHYLCTAGLFPTLQSGFRPRYSAETVRPICCVRHGQL